MEFNEAFDRLIDHEGGYTSGKGDPGGETKFGISKRSYPYLDIKNLTRMAARKIYLRDFWNGPRIDELPENIRFDLFDAGVNHGPGRAVQFLQLAVGVADDGIVGPITLKAARDHDPENLAARFNAFRILFFVKLNHWERFSKGWMIRVAKNLLIESAVKVRQDDELDIEKVYNVMLSSISPITITEGENQ